MNISNKKYLVSIPTGSMKEVVWSLLVKAGFDIPNTSGRKLDFQTEKIIFSLVERKFRNAELLSSGIVDIAIGTDDYFLNSGYFQDIISIGNSIPISRKTNQLVKFVLVGNKKTALNFSPKKLRGKIIATEMWRLSKIKLMEMYRFSNDDIVVIDNDSNELYNDILKRNKIIKRFIKEQKIILLKSDGNTEASVVPDGKGSTVADFCLEISETGESILVNNLAILDVIFESGLSVFITLNNLKDKKIFTFLSMVNKDKMYHRRLSKKFFLSNRKHMLKTAICLSPMIEKMERYKKPVGMFNSNSNTAKAYFKLWEEIKEKIN